MAAPALGAGSMQAVMWRPSTEVVGFNDAGTTRTADVVPEGCHVVRLWAEAACFIEIVGGNLADASDGAPLSAGHAEYVQVQPKISRINVRGMPGASGNLYVTYCD